MSSNRCFLITVIVLLLGVAAVAAPPPTITIIASGTAMDEDAAIKQALRNAVQQAVGMIVDAETLVKNDTIVKEQILTASNAIVTKYDRVGKPTVENGLITVTIKAEVERRQLTQRLEKASVVSKEVQGKDLFAQVVTDLQREQDAAKIVRRAFEGFPGNVLRAEPVGKPRIISRTPSQVKVGVTIQFGVDAAKYAKWQETVIPFLTKVADKSEELRWNPTDFPNQVEPLMQLSSDRQFVHDPLQKMNPMNDRYLWTWLPKSAQAGRTLTILQRQGSTRAIHLHISESMAEEVFRAAHAIPVVEIVLKGDDGQELDGRTLVAGFGNWGNTGIFCSPSLFFDRDFNPQQVVDEKQLQLDYKPNFQNDVKNGCIVAPYVGGRIRFDKRFLMNALNVEIAFDMPLDTLNKLRTVQVKISSRNN